MEASEPKRITSMMSQAPDTLRIRGSEAKFTERRKRATNKPELLPKTEGNEAEKGMLRGKKRGE
jgi:hypothetical protein